jgi:aspartyl protease family protein
MDIRENRFLEPEGGSIMGWAVRWLVFWLIAGVAIYLVVANRGLLMPGAAWVKPAESVATVQEPKSASDPAANSLILRAGRDGHVYAQVAVDGVPIRMVVDTGATQVVLTLRDAQAVGFSANSLIFSGQSGTANGVTRYAPIELREVRIGQLEIDDVHAAVVEHLDVSLLGQTFLSRLDSYQMHDGVLTLTW